jgi:NADH-quinone oxidoreductase subunit A
MDNLIAISLMAVIVGGLAVIIIWLTTVLGPKSSSPVKSEPFEMGEKPFRIVKGNVPIQFYLIALLFVVFDVELTFLFPWALVFRQLGMQAFISMGIFLLLLFLTLVYALKKGVLSWSK